ncbi:MAG TPA: SNF2-related protein [Haliscomenobacter sp.]|nr:SNF2-related protein [Haliscomenobacter sp.]
MSFPIKELERYIHPTILERGKMLFLEDAVQELAPASPNQWQALVRGDSDKYRVEIHMEDDKVVEHDCTCPYYAGPICKHRVAVLMELREKWDKDPVFIHTLTAKRTPEQLYQEFRALSPDNKLVLRILAVAYEGVNINKFTYIITDARFKVEFSQATLRNNLNKLVQTGFLTREKADRYLIDPDFADYLLDQEFQTEKDILKAIPSVKRFSDSEWWLTNSPDKARRAFRNARLAYYQDDLATFTKEIQTADTHSPKSGEPVWRAFLPNDFDQKKLEKAPISIRYQLLISHLSLMLLHLKPLDGYFHFLLEKDHLPSNTETRNTILRLMAQLAIFQGDWNLVTKLSKHFDELNQLSFAAQLQLSKGKYREATVGFELAQKAYRKQSRNNKSLLPGLNGIFHLLARCKDLDMGASTPLQDELRRQIKLGGNYLDVFTYLDAVISMYTGGLSQAKAVIAIRSWHSIGQFFQTLATYWVDETMIDVLATAALAENLQIKRYRWLAWQLWAILAQIDPHKPAWAQAMQALEQDGDDWVPLIKIFPKVEVWESALNALLNLSSKVKPSTEEGATRVVWLVDFENLEAVAKEQTFGKKGWTSGRNISINRLVNREVKGMTEQDATAVKKGVIRAGYDQYELNAEAVFPSLVGHPYLFLMKSPEIAVQLLQEKPILQTREVEGGYEIFFSREINEVGYEIVKESPTRYKLIQYTEEHYKVAKALQKQRLFVPLEAQSRLKEALAGLMSLVDVESTAVSVDADAREVEADARPCVHLLPVGDGFHVELYIKPFTDNPPYLQAGEGEVNIAAKIDDEWVRTQRDLEVEMANQEKLLESVAVLREYIPHNNIWELEDADVCLELLLQLQPFIDRQEIILEWPKGEKFRITRVAGLGQFSMNINSRQDWFEVKGELRVDENMVLNMRQLIELSQQKRNGFVEIGPGQFLALTEEFRRRLQEINALMAPNKDGTYQLHPLAAPAMESFTSLLDQVEADKRFKESIERMKQAFTRRYTPPAAFKATLREYQTEGFEWLCRLADWGVGACLADDMGLGKTVQALALLQLRAEQGPALVVAPASVCRNWVAEIGKFTPELTPVLFGEGDREAEIDNAKPGQILITTYDLLTREAESFTKKIFSTIILDEAQAIKNRATKRSETAMRLQGDFKLITTGTPLENHLGELWNLFQFINPGLLGSMESFNERFAVPIERFGDDSRRDQLRRLIQPFILRRRKDEVLKELPEKTEITLTVELSGEEKAFYEALRRKALEDLEQSMEGGMQGGQKHLRILAEIMRLRRAACHPGMVDRQFIKDQSAKLRLFGEVVEELLENGHKALVFSQFVDHLSILENYLKTKNINYQYLDGQTPLPTRQKRIEAFQAGDGDLFLISLKAGGVGLNLTAADYVIHMDPWWNPAVEDQATDRAHRIGQEKPVTVYRLVAEDTIEEKILKLHSTKRDLADSLLSGSDVSARLSADDLLNLLRDR